MLRGWPGRAYLHFEFTFENTSGQRLETPRVVFLVCDQDTEQSTWLDLEMPFALAMMPATTYTSWLDVDANDLHLREDWTWSVELEFEEHPLGG